MPIKTEEAPYFTKVKSTGTYLRPFRTLTGHMRTVERNGRSVMIMNEDEFLAIIQMLLSSIRVDEEWYRRKYPDVALAIDAGLFKGAQDHFVENGYFEERVPYQIMVDPEFYLSAYPDVADSIRAGLFRSAQDHFERVGYQEGRLPAEHE